MLKKIFKRTSLKRTIFFLVSDIVFICIAVWLAFLMRFDGFIPENFVRAMQFLIAVEIELTIPVFYYFKLYSFSWAYVSATEAVSLFWGTFISFVFSIISVYIFRKFLGFEMFPRSTVFISYFLIFFFAGTLRFSKRVWLQSRKSENFNEKEKTLIVGAGDAGEQILRGILLSKTSQYNPIGFVDDNPIKKGVTIHGLKVLGKIDEIEKVCLDYDVRNIIIALPSAGTQTIRKAIELGKKAKIRKIKIAPPLTEVINGQVSIRNLKEVGVEDLLGRDKVQIDTKKIESFIKEKNVLITGAAGSIGSELAKQVAKFQPKEILLLDQDETGIFNISKEILNNFSGVKIKSIVADVTDKKRIDDVLKSFAPQIVFHAAAYKHVPLMEENSREAIKNNIFGTKTLADSSIENGVENFIFISTDKAINPTSVMGSTKRVGEMICQASNRKTHSTGSGHTKFVSVRFGNVLNSRGSVIPIFREQIAKGGPVEVTDPKMKRYFMLTSEACLLVMQAGAMGNGGEVFVLNMGEPVKIVDLAREMIKLSGFEPDKDIAIVFTGIRPGEKLFEEMLTSSESATATQSTDIFIAKLTDTDYNDLQEKLEKFSDISSDAEIKSVLKDIVCNYKV